LAENKIMLHNSSFVSNKDFHGEIVPIVDFYGTNTAEVVKTIDNHHQPGQIKLQEGGIVWRAISICENGVLLVGQRVRVVVTIESSLLKVVEPIVLALPERSISECSTNSSTDSECSTESRIANSGWAQQHKRKENQRFSAS
jgi:hypothetical protein